MQHKGKDFAERLNKCLDEMGMPINSKERSATLSKMLDIPKQQAWNLTEGHLIPDDTLLQQIATELEVEPNWLLGK